jgi:long-subunit fatty acid transport protein
MRNTSILALIAGLSAGMAQAGGVDRSGQSIAIIFEKGNYAELSYGVISPNVDGTDVASRPTQSVAGDHVIPGIAFKYNINDKLSVGMIYETAYGADIYYPTAADGGSVMLGGTSAKLNSDVITGLARYKFNENFSVHGGIRASKASGDVTLGGLAYGGLNGYNVHFGEAWGAGYMLGVAYERPDIALRVALTYFSKVTHDLDTTEYIGATQVAAPSVTSVDTPQAINLDFQSGVAKDTLVFGSIRWVDWSNFLIDPAWFTPRAGGGLVSLEDSVTYTLGVGRKFNDNWSGSLFVSYEGKGDPLVSPLAPTNGYKSVGVAAIYTRDNIKITMGARYIALGDAQPETGTPDTARANMTDNDAIAVGVKVGFTF